MLDQAISPESLIAFVERERDVARSEYDELIRLPIEELVERGAAIVGLRIVATVPAGVVMRCAVNDSRLRVGDRIALRYQDHRIEATIAEMLDQGRELRIVSQARGMVSGPWTAQALPVDVSSLVISCLRRLTPGAPGWWWFRTLATQLRPGPVESRHEAPIDLQALADDQGLDDQQRAILFRSVELPDALAVQGPPGSGKSRLLSTVAEALARRGKRVLVVAPTHQAVNNALSTIRRQFPSRRTVKVGDELRREALDDGVECRLFEDGTRYSGLPASADTITGMTLITALHHLVLRRSGLAPNVVLVDEAGQVPLAHGACLGLIGAGSILLFGDDAQMPPVFAGDVAGDPLACSLFAALRRSRPGAVLMLDTTYRLNDDLCRLVGQAFYQGRLRPSQSARDRRLRIGQPIERRLIRVLSADPAFTLVRSPRSAARQHNEVEARFAADIVARCLRRGLSPDQVAVVTPFRRQAALVRGLLQAQLPPNSTIPIVDTVERVQGLTVEVIVVSMTAADGPYIESLADFLFQPNRLNVALSRARVKAVLLVSDAIIETVARSGSPGWRSILAAAADPAELSST